MRTVLTSVVFWGFLVLLSIPPFFIWGPNLETRLFPVLGKATITATRVGNDVTFFIEVTKFRFCRLDTFNWQLVRVNPVNNAMEIFPVAVTLSGSVFTGTYPAGLLHIGPYDVTIPPHFAGEVSIQVVEFFDCHPMWLTRALLGPMPIPPA